MGDNKTIFLTTLWPPTFANLVDLYVIVSATGSNLITIDGMITALPALNVVAVWAMITSTLISAWTIWPSFANTVAIGILWCKASKRSPNFNSSPFSYGWH